jgi:anti-sigma regulatory factor (Ser/Thr protein kinase)
LRTRTTLLGTVGGKDIEVRFVERTLQRWQILRGDVRAATNARREFAQYVASTNADPDQTFDAKLIFGELVGNAVKCARHEVIVEVLEDGWAKLRVVDDGDCFDRFARIAPQPTSALGGRGLYIVNQLARSLAVNAGEQRCEVTAILPIRP